MLLVVTVEADLAYVSSTPLAAVSKHGWERSHLCYESM